MAHNPPAGEVAEQSEDRRGSSHTQPPEQQWGAAPNPSTILPPDTNESHLLGEILGSHLPLAIIANNYDTTVTAIAEWMATPEIEQRIALIERTAQTRARVQAAEGRTAAIEALTNILYASTLDTARDRQTTQRAAAALLRISTPPNHKPRKSNEPQNSNEPRAQALRPSPPPSPCVLPMSPNDCYPCLKSIHGNGGGEDGVSAPPVPLASLLASASTPATARTSGLVSGTVSSFSKPKPHSATSAPLCPSAYLSQARTRGPPGAAQPRLSRVNSAYAL